MNKALAVLAMLLGFASVSTFAQNDPPVGVTGIQNGNSVREVVYNNSASTVCIYPYVYESDNVYGSVVPSIQVEPGEQNVNIGAFAQANSQLDWSVEVRVKYRTGTCA